jgi:hypothetical protein
VCLCRYETIIKIEAHHEHKKTHDFCFNKKGSFDKESLGALRAKIPTRLKQVKTDIIKQKTIIGQASSSPIRLASPQQLLMGTKKLWSKFESFKIYVAFFAPYLDHWCFQISRTFHRYCISDLSLQA